MRLLILIRYGGLYIRSLTRECNVLIILCLLAELCASVRGRDKESSLCATVRETLGIGTTPIERES
jgi:hypothetical protein